MTAAYSPRPNTPMATWPDQLPDSVKDERLQIINRLVGEHALERSQRCAPRRARPSAPPSVLPALRLRLRAARR